MKKKINKEPKQNGLTMKQIESYLKKAKGSKKFYWKGRKDSFKGSLRYQDWLLSLKNKKQRWKFILYLKYYLLLGQ